MSPLILTAKTTSVKEDNPTWWQAMNGRYAEEFEKQFIELNYAIPIIFTYWW